MNIIPINVKQAIASHARCNINEEVCGLILKTDAIVPIENILPVGDVNDLESITKHNDFRMPDDIIPTMGDKIQAIYHSHWREESPAMLTSADIIQSRAVQIPYIVYHVGFDKWDLWDSNGLHPWPLSKKRSDPKRLEFYTGWPWEWARADCLTLLRSYYKGMLNHDIADFQRTATEHEFQQRLRDGSWNDYEENLGDQGIIKVFDGEPNRFKFQLHDIVLMRLQGANPHHVGIVVDLQPLKILHHLESGRLSEVVLYGKGRIRQTASVWRIG